MSIGFAGYLRTCTATSCESHTFDDGKEGSLVWFSPHLGMVKRRLLDFQLELQDETLK